MSESLFVEDGNELDSANGSELQNSHKAALSTDNGFVSPENYLANDDLIPLITMEASSKEPKFLGAVDVNSTLSLKFQQTVLEELLAEDSLLVLAKGLGQESIVANLLHVVSTPSSKFDRRSLVILLNSHEKESHQIGEELNELSWTDLVSNPIFESDNSMERQFTVIKGESVISKKRRELYKKGGIISISSRIFIVDLLSKIVDALLITGLVILNADKISETSNESFIINYYRAKNTWGFVKCITDDPQSLINTAYSDSGGSTLSPLRVILRNMKLEKCILWPRFHINVITSLNFKAKSDIGKVIEIKVAMTESMQKIQIAILSCLKALLYEIKRHNPEITIESELFQDLNRGSAHTRVGTDITNEDEYSRFLDDYFLTSVMVLFNKSWHRISWTTKQLISDLSMLRRLLSDLINTDAVEFYENIELILNEHRAHSGSGRMNYNGSPWLMLDEANTITSYAKKRVFEIENKSYLLEELPKWEQLALLLHDIYHEKETAKHSQKDGPVLIMCSNARTVNQIKEYLKTVDDESTENINEQQYSARTLMQRKFRDYIYWKDNSMKVSQGINESLKDVEAMKQNQINELLNTTKQEEASINVSKTFNRDMQPTSKRRRTRGAGFVAQLNKLHTADFNSNVDVKLESDIADKILTQIEDIDFQEEDHEQEFRPNEEVYEIIAKSKEIVVEKFDLKADDRVLNEILPSYIIMFEPSLEFVRRIEVFQAENRLLNLKTYLMYYGASIEEQRYLTIIKKEKQSFARLVKEKGEMGKEFKHDRNIVWGSDEIKGNTRIAGGNRTLISVHKFPNKKVIVDIREFRSALPNILFRSGFEVVPCVLTVGDYVLSPSVCVERKSVPDLIGSFEKGNLYSQCTRMFRHYLTVILLIEFDQGKSFALNPFLEFKNKYDSTLMKSRMKDTHSAKKSLEDVRLKLAMLLLAFPSLKIVWSPSPYKTADIYKDLKAGLEDPDVETAVAAGLDSESALAIGEIQHNDNAIDMVKNIPGINDGNILVVIRHVRSIQELVRLEEFELAVLIGNENAGKAYRFIHQNIIPIN